MIWLTVLVVYLWSIIQTLNVTLGVTAIVTGIMTLILTLVWLEQGENDKSIGKFLKKVFSVFVISVIANVLIPSQDSFKYIIGAGVIAYTAESISEIEGVDKLPSNVVLLLNNIIEDLNKEFGEKVQEVVTESK